jgi:hypothetical protein
MSPEELTILLEKLGCPAAISLEMARQLDRRARQLAAQQKQTYEDSLAHLLALMRQGWAGKEKGL